MATSNLKHTWSTSIKNDSGAAVVADPPVVVIGNAEVNFSSVVAAGETAEIDAAITVSKIQSGFLTATANCSITTNATDATGGQTFAVVKGQSIAWNNVQVGSSPFTINITKFFVHNTGTAALTVRGGFLLVE